MAAQAPGVFFAEWRDRAPGQRRDIGRAAALLDLLGLPAPAAPVLGVVGSKGKGTCAVYSSATLAAAGARVVTVTSPGIRGPRDRIRLDGTAVGAADLDALAAEVGAAMRRLPPPEGGYLSPSGLFLAAGALYGLEQGADLLVLEAGVGGRGDELRLFDPAAVALTGVFAEHLGVLGDSVERIAAEKAAVTGPGARAFVHGPLDAGVRSAAHAALASRSGGGVFPESVAAGAAGVPAELLPEGLGRTSAEVGCTAARRLLAATGRAAPGPARLHEVLASVRLPGRLSHHAVPGCEVVVDSAVDRVGTAAALDHARRRLGGVDHVLICLPDHKDVAGAAAALEGLQVTAAVLPDAHLHFSAELPRPWGRVRAEEITPDLLAGLGRRVLVLGTVYFTGRVLDAIGADTESLFSV
ncbi:hypothetical protein [Streptomonospora litoralis]|uniref:Folylpolyglutamate synthase n=1 Tax=Streptomonospora litoralis TaxID=2498135 RepID=A0A4V0ZJH7_9ACTN|nr:hypothetical protein [Streptomonospora litoralis]QBI53522.1 Folylpolyglutamate synthase [Streptomonospora litoralis]